ncbi:hypothetical protein PAXINDRAFT_160791 [Paxillus involutus ATCC 200175]|nr:hypothetical protein PAXINDRAFT_160791 [Paxillus involutus ATCC 200175]
MEKFSAFRPFLPLLPPSENTFYATSLAPIHGTLAVIRSLLVIVIALLHSILVNVLCTILIPIPPLRRLVGGVSTVVLARLVLYVLGFVWIPEELVARRRGKLPEIPWSPKAGDVIVSNWSSWIDILWLSYRFNPVFVLPLVDEPMPLVHSPNDSTPISHRPGRVASRGSAAISIPTPTISPRQAIRGFCQVSLLSMVWATGRTPQSTSSGSFSTLEDIRNSAERPVVVLPECTTSNGRGLLRFAHVFEGINVPTKGYNVFVMCIRYDPPTIFQPTLAHPIASSTLNPLRHLFAISSALSPQSMSVRMLPLSESPSSQLFMLSEVVTDPTIDVLSEACAALIARIGKMKRIGFGWEDKVAFLTFYRGRRK